MKFAKVVIDQDAKAIDREFEYIIPEELDVKLGERVNVPFGSRVLQGFVVGESDTSSYDEHKLKSILSTVDGFPVIKKEMLALMNYMVYVWKKKEVILMHVNIMKVHGYYVVELI